MGWLVARTLRRQMSVKHPVHKQQLTTRERARLQSFPDDVWFSGTVTQQRNQIGKAVPVCLATRLAERIYQAHCKVHR